MQKTYMAKPDQVERTWHLVDAEGQNLGRLASRVASILRGKHKAIYTPHLDTGDFVIVVNAEKVNLTGKKLDRKLYRRHSGYIGGLKEKTYRRFMEDDPVGVIVKAVRGMLPHNSLGRAMLKKLKVYAGPEHPHKAQQPKKLEF